MGYFTPQLYEVLEFEHDTGNGLRIGLDDYPIWKPAYRDGLNRKIIGRYLNREIGLETVPLFTHQLRQKMWEIMPFFNQLYASTEIEFGPLDTFDLTTERDDTSTETGESSGTGDSTVKSTSSARNITSDTPQTLLSEDEDYASGGSDANSVAESDTDSKQSGTSKTEATNAGKTRVTGFQGSAADQLQKYRQTFLNIDLMILTELNELFMVVLSNQDEILPASPWGARPYGSLY